MKINVVFSGDNPMEMKFVEVETLDGKSINIGEWVKDKDGFTCLQFDVNETSQTK